MNEADNNELSEIFDMTDVMVEAENIPPDNITPEESATEDPDVILQTNIDKANLVLDKIISDVDRGLTVGMVEATASIINSITNAVDKMYAGSFNFENVQIKKQMVELEGKKVYIKNKALEMKGQGVGGGSVPMKQENILIADREAVMALFKDKDVVKRIEESIKDKLKGKEEV